MEITIKNYLDTKKVPLLNEHEIRFLGVKTTGNQDKVIQPKCLRELYVYALANVNKDKRYLHTALTIEKLTKGSTSFKQIRNTVGNPTRRYWGMSNLEFITTY